MPLIASIHLLGVREKRRGSFWYGLLDAGLENRSGSYQARPGCVGAESAGG